MKNKPGVVIIDGHVQGLANARALGEIGIPVVIVDRNKYAIAKYTKYCQKFYKSPDYLSPEFADYLIKLAINENLKDWLLLPSDDHIVLSISRRKRDLEKYFKIITVDLPILNNIIDKRNLFTIANECDVPTIKTYYPKILSISKDIVENLRYPVLIKGIEGQTFYKKTNHKAYQVNDFESLQQTINNIPSTVLPTEVMIQELIPLENGNKVISFTAFCIKGEIKSYWMGKKMREHPINFGTATFTQSLFIDVLLKQSIPLLKKLKYEGVCEIEYLFDPRDDKYYLIEINPRTWLWVGLAKTCGINFPLMIYKYVNQIDQEFPSNYATSKFWINIWTDTFFSIKYIINGNLSFTKYIKSLFQKKSFAVFQLSDLKPFIMMGVLLIYFKRKR